MLSLGIVVPDKFYELLEADKEMHLFSPYDVSKFYGVPFSHVDITKEYDNMVTNPLIRSTTIRARDLDIEIGKLQQESGYPYILNVDTANRANPIKGKIVMSNLCSEILQSQVLSDVNDRQEYTTLGEDISCNLGSLNMPRVLESTVPFGETIDTAVRALTTVTRESSIDTVPSVKNGNDKNRTIGLGLMGYHTLLASNQIHYGSQESLQVIDIYAMMVNYYSLKTSNEIAKETKSPFESFSESTYADGSYFDQYLEETYVPTYPKVTEMFGKHHIPTKEDWAELKQSVMEHGVYSAYRLAVAPNGSISYINETSASLHPIISLVEERQDKKLGKTYYPAPRLGNDTMDYYKSAYDTSMIDLINVYATAQKHIDQGMSLTLFLRSEIPAGLYPWLPNGGKFTTREVTLLRQYAWKKGIKTIYYVRTYTEDDGEVGVSTCESCVI